MLEEENILSLRKLPADGNKENDYCIYFVLVFVKFLAIIRKKNQRR